MQICIYKKSRLRVITLSFMCVWDFYFDSLNFFSAHGLLFFSICTGRERWDHWTQHGVRRCLETIIVVLLPIFACNSSVYVGALGENYLQYPFFIKYRVL